MHMPVDAFEDHCWKDVFGPNDFTVYAPYRRRVRIGERPAVLAIDLHRCVFPDAPLPVIEAMWPRRPSSTAIC